MHTYPRTTRVCKKLARVSATLTVGGCRQTCELIQDAVLDYVVVAFPWVIRDTYEEVMESLARLAEAGTALRIARSDRKDTEQK
jgi:hypothetical protein